LLYARVLRRRLDAQTEEQSSRDLLRAAQIRIRTGERPPPKPPTGRVSSATTQPASLMTARWPPSCQTPSALVTGVSLGCRGRVIRRPFDHRPPGTRREGKRANGVTAVGKSPIKPPACRPFPRTLVLSVDSFGTPAAYTDHTDYDSHKYPAVCSQEAVRRSRDACLPFYRLLLCSLDVLVGRLNAIRSADEPDSPDSCLRR